RGAPLIMPRMLETAAEITWCIGWWRQVAHRAVGLRHSFFQSGGRLEEHVRKFLPRNRPKQKNPGDKIESEENIAPQRAAACLRPGPDQAEGRAEKERNNKQIRTNKTER